MFGQTGRRRFAEKVLESDCWNVRFLKFWMCTIETERKVNVDLNPSRLNAGLGAMLRLKRGNKVKYLFEEPSDVVS